MAATALLATTALCALPAAAEEGRVTVGISGGTYGIGPELAYRFNEHVGLRASGGFLTHNDSEDIDDIDYDSKLKLKSVGAALDWFPAGGGFRVSVGGRANNNKIHLRGTPNTNVEIGDITYTPAQAGTLTGTVEGAHSFAPTLTLGYGGKLAPGFTLGFELGVMAQGSPKIRNLQSTGGTLSSNAAFLAELEQERQQAEDDVDNFKLWPVLQLGFLYRF
jgi:hypothetical protein